MESVTLSGGGSGDVSSSGSGSGSISGSGSGTPPQCTRTLRLNGLTVTATLPPKSMTMCPRTRNCGGAVQPDNFN
ncbi:hypothetical protein J6590_003079 [Homalodisca vitripennis]|nr:hypothetical protein J6590_003079 [Homalodisca vitripennis]